jgi:hypothetical protein
MQIESARGRQIQSVRNGQIQRTKGADQSSRMMQNDSHGSRTIYKEAQITAEITSETPKKQDSEAELPPTPLLEGGDESVSEQPDRTTGLLAEFKLRLKDDLQNASFRARHLAFDEYDHYFRETWFLAIRDGVVLVGGADLAVSAEGLQKYARRLKETFRRIAGVNVEFRMVEANGNGERIASGHDGRTANA